MRRIFDDQGLIDDPEPPTVFRDAGESHAKVKARDIIEGWPMSPSTTGFHGEVDDYIWTEHFYSMLRHQDLEYITLRMGEIQQTADYHLNQRMRITECIRNIGSLEMFRCIILGGAYLGRYDGGNIHEPGYWRNEVSGQLAPVVEAFIQQENLTADQVVMLKLYFKQWIWADVWSGSGPEIAHLRVMLDEVVTQHGLNAWLMRAMDLGIDPL